MAGARLGAQNLTLEGQTGGFITPTAYAVYTDKGHVFSHPAVGYHFIDADQVIGNIHTFSIEEGLANRAEAGYTRVVHTEGDSALFSSLWHFAGMNVFNGKGVAIKDGQWHAPVPGVAAGFVVRTGDKFVTGALDQELTGVLKSYTNGDIYVVATKTWLHPPFPFLANLGWKATNATIYGLGGQSTRFGGRLFGGLGIPIPGTFQDGDCAGGWVHAGAGDGEEPEPDPGSAGEPGAYSHYDGLRSAHHAEGPSAFCVRRGHRSGGGDDRDYSDSDRGRAGACAGESEGAIGFRDWIEPAVLMDRGS